MKHDDYDLWDKGYDRDITKKVCSKCGATNYASVLICSEGCGSDEFTEEKEKNNEYKMLLP